MIKPVMYSLQQDTRPIGEKVFVNLGSLTVRAGMIYAIRVTAHPNSSQMTTHKTEYQILWYAENDPSPDWYSTAFVHSTAEEAFK